MSTALFAVRFVFCCFIQYPCRDSSLWCLYIKFALIRILALSLSYCVISNCVSPYPHLKPGIVFTSEDCCNDYCMYLNDLAHSLEPKFCSKENSCYYYFKSADCFCIHACLS